MGTVTYLPVLHQEPGRVVAGLLHAIRHRRLGRIAGNFLRDLRRDPTANRLRRLGQALVLACELPPEVTCIYAHYLHTPTSVARYAARLLGLRFAVSAHAKDIWTTPAWEKREKLVDAAWVTTCTEMGFGHLHSLAPTARLLHLPHGVDLARLPRPPARDGATGVSPGQPIELVTVARAVEKKGLDTLLEALAMLPPTIHWRWRHIGAGPLQPCCDGRPRNSVSTIASMARRHPTTPWSSVSPGGYLLPRTRTAADGDRDGIPNVVAGHVPEPAVVCTTGRAVAELVEDGRTGLLVPAGMR